MSGTQKMFYPYNEEEKFHYRRKLTPEQLYKVFKQMIRMNEMIKSARILSPEEYKKIELEKIKKASEK